jgi:hypothetical protein
VGQIVDRPWRRRLFGIVVCALASGMMLFLLGAVASAVEYDSLADWMDRLSRLRFGRVFRGLIIVQSASLPIVIIFALIIHWLHKLRADSLLVVGMVGAVIGLLAILIAVILFSGGIPNFKYPEDLLAIPLLLVPGAVLGILYWLLVVRVERRFADVQRHAALAIRAME